MNKFNLTNDMLNEDYNAAFPDISKCDYKNENDRKRYEFSREQLKNARQAFETFTKIANTISNDHTIAIAICQQMCRTHRTLQQATFGSILEGMVAYLKWAKENGCFDARNEAAVEMSEKLKEILDENPLPFI